MLAANNGQVAHAGSGVYSGGEPLAVTFNTSLVNQDALLLADLNPRGRQVPEDEIVSSEKISDVDGVMEATSSFPGQPCSLQRHGDVNNGR